MHYCTRVTFLAGFAPFEPNFTLYSSAFGTTFRLTYDIVTQRDSPPPLAPLKRLTASSKQYDERFRYAVDEDGEKSGISISEDQGYVTLCGRQI